MCKTQNPSETLSKEQLLEQLNIYHPQQIEFARLNINFTILSKRKLKKLVDEKYVDGWDDPRMPTISGLRRRGYTPQSIQKFILSRKHSFIW